MTDVSLRRWAPAVNFISYPAEFFESESFRPSQGPLGKNPLSICPRRTFSDNCW
jgi:hypothetical protein